MQNEIWKKCPLLPDNYEVSNLGRVRHFCKGEYHIKGLRLLKDGYYQVKFGVNGKKTSKRVSRCIATAFIPNPNNLSDVNHINFNKLDNSVENLEWLSNKDNVRHYYDKYSKPVYKYTKQGELLRIYSSQAEVARIEEYKYPASINQCIKGTIRTAYGYIWSENKLPQEHFIKYNQWVESNTRNVACYTKDGQLVKIYTRASEAKLDGYSECSISDCLAGRGKTHRKLIWKVYKKDDTQT